MDVNVQERIAEARRRAIPIPWAPPMHDVDWLPFRRVHRPLVAEAAASRLRGLVPALRAADPRWAQECEHLIRVLDAATIFSVRAA